MSDERDIQAIATWERAEQSPDPNEGRPEPYVCTECTWTGRGGVKAFAHHHVTGHAVRGKQWPEAWGNALFTVRSER